MKTLVVPPRCVATLPEDLEKDHFIGEEKLDGSRYILYIGHDPYERQKNVPNTLLSRRLSVKDGKHVDRSENLPHITGQEYKGLEGTILDGEVMGEKEDGKVAGSSILLSSPALAVQKQEAEGWLSYNVFDISFFRGEDIRSLNHPLDKAWLYFF